MDYNDSVLEEVLTYATRKQKQRKHEPANVNSASNKPDAELSRLIFHGGKNVDSVNWHKLSLLTNPMPFDKFRRAKEIHDKIKYIYIFDDEEVHLCGLVENPGERFYVSKKDQSWLLVWGTNYDNIAPILALCQRGLLHLDVRCSRLETLQITHLKDLKHLHIESLTLRSTSIIDVVGLEKLPNLESLSLTHTWTKDTLDLSMMANLSTLQLSDNPVLTKLTGLDKLQNLRILHISNTAIGPELDLSSMKKLASISLKRMKKLTALRGLDQTTHLEGLVIYDTALEAPVNLSNLNDLETLSICESKQLLAIHGLSSLGNVRSLNLSGLMVGPEIDLSGMKSMNRIDLVNNPNLSLVTGIEGMNNLRILDISKTGIKNLPDGIRGKNLEILGLCNLSLDELPVWLSELGLDFGTHRKYIPNGIKLHYTTIKDVDMSIFEQPYDVICKWFTERKLDKTQTLNEIKVVFLGDGEAGKSHTIARLMGDGGDPVDYTDKSTPGIVIKHKPYTHDGRDFQVHYWDFGGQEIMHSMHRIFLTSRTMYVVLLNARDDTQGDRAHYWLQNIQSFAPDAPVLLVLNKIDQNPKASVDERTLRAKYPGLRQIVRMSALEFSQELFNREFRDVLLEEIVNTGCLDAQWPGSWIKVKERLEKMETHFILGDEYKRICAECELKDVELSMLKYFNELGVSFCFCDEEDYELEDHVILRPDWITNGLYIILFNQLADAKNGLIPHKSIYKLLRSAHCSPDIRCTLPNARYDSSDIHYVLGVMRKFDLSFTDGKDNEFIPMLCQQESTVDIAKFERDDQVLEFNMEFEYLPENLLHRLMVERREELDMDSAWRRGARFRIDKLGYSAVVLIDVNNTLRFFIRHSDPMHRPNTYLTVLKDNVDRIVEKMGLNPPTNQLVYKLEGKIGTFDYEELRQAREDHEESVYSKTWRRRIQIDDILNQSAPDGLQNEMLLLTTIQEACGRIQDEPIYRLVKNSNGKGYENGKGMEDLRNRRVRDDLLIQLRDRFQVCDQTQIGSSGSGKSIGELDMLIRKKNNEPWTIIEALRIEDGKKGSWNDHLDKLLVKYNSRGLSLLYLLTYVDANPQSFVQICDEYKTHIPRHASGQYAYVANSFTDLNDNKNQSFHAVKCAYSCGGDPITVYHIFARIPLQGE